MHKIDNNYAYSYHHFLFPFRWDILKDGFKISDVKEEKYKFDDRTNLDKAIELIENENWKRKIIKKIETTDQYNELTYFHEFVRHVIYDFETDFRGPIMRYFEYDLEIISNKSFTISYWQKKTIEVNKDKRDKVNYESKYLELDISGITLHLYNTGIGVLSYNLENNKVQQSDPKSILLINEFGRRIYPQFLGNDKVWDAQRVFLPESITVGEWKEDYLKYNDLSKLSFQKTFIPPRFIRKLFTDKILFSVDNDLKGDKILLSKVLDDRMFFLSWYGNSHFSNTIGKDYLNSNWWYSYIFGDKTPGGSIANNAMKKKQIEEHTYERWSQYGTLYGMSRDSFVCLSADAEFLEKNDYPLLHKHVNAIYYQITVLALVQRASVVKFSAEVANLSDMAKAQSDADTLDRIKELYMNYIEFINKIYFREVTSQIQGIEIYNQFHKVMKIVDDVMDLDSEIQELHNYAEMVKQYQMAKESKEQTIESNNQTKEATRLTQVAAWFLPVTLVAGILGMNTFDSIFTVKFSLTNINWRLTFKMLVTWGIIVYSIYIICRHIVSSKKQKKLSNV